MKALCVLHDAFSSTGLIGAALRARGWEVDEVTIVPAERYGTPDVEFAFPDYRDYDLIVPLGSPWAAYDDEAIGSWLKPELDWLARIVADDGAVFGICFGAQALARALGGSVARGPRPEIGWTAIEPDDPAIEPGPWFQWHFDAFTPPPGATVLARNDAAIQAYRVGRCLGVQFHPEVTAFDITMWLDNGGRAEARAQGIDPADLLAEAERRADAARARTEALTDHYLTAIFPA
ncbi:MAG TPA: type 1 glutamine amidotransferase [Actinospica sp.]|nr:type 1 glutamine amidotransferase [Actinospica sp.]